jgi:acyl-CoA dehydrogenase
MNILNPKKYTSLMADEGSRTVVDKTIAFFEGMGKKRLLEDFDSKAWYQGFTDFLAKEQILAKLLTPKEHSGGDPDCRWDTARNGEYAEILGFYGLGYWYYFQCTLLGLGPVWMSKNENAKKKAAQVLKEGSPFAFGLSERAHGADIYATETTLTPKGDGTYLANGEKYYIGNGNKAKMVSVHGKVKDGTDDFVFFVANYLHKAYELKGNVISHQEYVADFALHDYPITEEDILLRGREAWDAILNTVNIGKFNIGPGSIGLCEHYFYDAIAHAANRVLYGIHVTDMPHARRNFMDAWLRLIGMKLYQRRATDYFRAANADDRRYILYNATSKMKVTVQGEQVIELLWEVIAAKGFEKDTFFTVAETEVKGPAKLEGTVHVNVMLIRKFMKSYFFNPTEYPPIAPDFETKDDLFLFNQGVAHGLGSIRFHDYRPAFEANKHLPNVAAFISQVETFKDMLEKAAPDVGQDFDSSFALPLGEMFSIVVYGQLILEQAMLYKLDPDVLNQIFDFMVRDFARFALQVYDNPSVREDQIAFLKEIILTKPVPDDNQYERVWDKHIFPLVGAYEMNP